MSNQAQDRTEQATPKRVKETREKGQIPRSRELNTMAVLLTAAATMILAGGGIGERLVSIMSDALTMSREQVLDPFYLTASLSRTLLSALLAMTPLFLAVIVAALVAPMALGGFSFSLKALAPKVSKLNPLSGLKRIFGPNGLVELAKALAKFLLVAVVAVVVLRSVAGDLLALGRLPVGEAIAATGRMCLQVLLILSGALIAIAAVDVPFQLWQHARQIRMTKQEVRDEHKETEGQPELKAKVRQMQQEIASRRMMEEVPKADVIVTNPTHYAVALKYDPEKGGAPRVVAKGADEVAANIREVGRKHHVPILSAPPLARALFRSTDLGKEIPAALYTAVAQVLAYVFQLRDALAAGMEPPPEPDVQVDNEFV